MNGRGDEKHNENILVMKCCCEKQIKELEEKLEEKDKRANERIKDLEVVGALF